MKKMQSWTLPELVPRFAWQDKFAMWFEDLPKKVIIKSKRQFMYGLNFYGSDVII